MTASVRITVILFTILFAIICVALFTIISSLNSYQLTLEEQDDHDSISYVHDLMTIEDGFDSTTSDFYHIYSGVITEDEVSARRVKLPRMLFKKISKGILRKNITDDLGSRFNGIEVKYKDLMNDTDSEAPYTFTTKRDIILDYDYNKYFQIISLQEGDEITTNTTRYQFYQDDEFDKDVFQRKRRSNAIMIGVIVVIIIVLLLIVIIVIYLLIKIRQGCVTPTRAEAEKKKLKMKKHSQLLTREKQTPNTL